MTKLYLKKGQHGRFPLQSLKIHVQGIIYKYSLFRSFQHEFNLKIRRPFLKKRAKSFWNTQSCEKLKMES